MSETHEHDALDAHLGRAPTRPDVPPPKRNGAKLALAILGGVVVLGIVGSLLGRGADAGETIAGPGTSASPAAPSQDNGGSDVTPEMIVDVMGPEKVGEFCSNYDAIGDYDAALAAFSKGYTQPDPPARDVFDELLSRC